MTISLAEIRALDATRWPTPTKLIFDQPPATPATIQVSGERNILRVQWTTVTGVDGYDVAVMTSPNLGAPDVNIVSLSGSKTREYVYQTGNNSLLRYFAVRSTAGGGVSAWSSPISATSTTSKDNNLSSASTDASLTGTTAETVIRTVSVGANTLGNNDGVTVYAWGQTARTVGTPTIRIRWGGLTGTIAATESTITTATVNWFLQAQIFNRNASNSQILKGMSHDDQGFDTLTTATAALDTTASQDIVLTGQLGAAADSTTCNLIDTIIVRGTASAADAPPPAPPGNPPSGDEPLPAGRFIKL